MERKVEFKSGKETLKGSLFIPQGKGPFPGVLFFHGSRSDRTRILPIASELARKGIMCLCFDFCGHGESDGSYENLRFGDCIENGQDALDFLKEQNVDKKRIGIRGSSLGGYVAGSLLLKNKIKSVMMNVPAAFVDKDMKLVESEQKGREFLNDKSNWSKSISYDGIRQHEGSLLIIRNERDSLLSQEMVEAYYNEANKAKKRKLYLMKGADHSIRDNPKAGKIFYKQTVDWFLKTL